MNYLLDTNACIALINGKPPSVRSRFRAAAAAGHSLYAPAVAAFELWYGVTKSARPENNRQRLQTFLAGPLALLPFDEEDAQTAGEIRAHLEATGKPIAAYDLLIAGQALRRELTLATANSREFRRVKGLACEDWSK